VVVRGFSQCTDVSIVKGDLDGYPLEVVIYIHFACLSFVTYIEPKSIPVQLPLKTKPPPYHPKLETSQLKSATLSSRLKLEIRFGYS
jgi:hypothetical protein